MRIAFIVLLLANLGFMAWAVWVDTPPQPQTSESTSRLPRLKLVTEVTPPRAQGGDSAATASKVSMSAGGAATASPAIDTLRSGGGGVGSVALTPTEPIAQTQRCVTVGPFNDSTLAARAASALHSHGFTPQQRAEAGEVVEGFWVAVGGVDSVDKADRILKALDIGGFEDAHLMPDDGAAEGRRISVGLFSERERAERRAKAVQKLGLKTQVAERMQQGTAYWVDLALRQSDGWVSVQTFLADAGGSLGAHLSVQSCPPAVVARTAEIPEAAPANSAPTVTRPPTTTVAGTPQLREAR